MNVFIKFYVHKYNKYKYSIWLSVDTRRNLNVRKTFRRRSGHLLNVLCTSYALGVVIVQSLTIEKKTDF